MCNHAPAHELYLGNHVFPKIDLKLVCLNRLVGDRCAHCYFQEHTELAPIYIELVGREISRNELNT